MKLWFNGWLVNTYIYLKFCSQPMKLWFNDNFMHSFLCNVNPYSVYVVCINNKSFTTFLSTYFTSLPPPPSRPPSLPLSLALSLLPFLLLPPPLSPGTFIIPYIIMLFLLGIPLFYLELLLGQSLRKGPILAWLKIVPNFAGIGIASVVVIVYICLYYNVIIAWVLFYLVNSFHLPLLWDKCFGYDVTGSNRTAILVNYTGNIEDLWRCFNESTE